MIKRYSVYSLDTGQLNGVQLVIDSSLRTVNTPIGYGLIEGHHDKNNKIVDLRNLEVVDYQPPQPSPEHEWNAETKRWQLTKEAQARNVADAQARAELTRLDESMLRPLGELAVDPNNTDALLRIDAINMRKLELRTKLKR